MLTKSKEKKMYFNHTPVKVNIHEFRIVTVTYT